MRHKKSKYQLNRFTSWRKATLISLARSLIIHQSIKTLLSKAKAVRPLIEKLIFLAKRNTLTAKRQAAKILNDHRLVSKLFNEIGPRFTQRGSGFTRIINLGVRRGDNARTAIIELTEIKKIEPKKPKKEIKAAEVIKPEVIKEKPSEEKKLEGKVAVKEKPPLLKKPSKKFFAGLRNIFKKGRDSL